MRARNIKPGFFKNDQLVECSFAARLLFVGLWCMADREGRLEDRPRKIKMEIFPGDNVSCAELLDELEAQDLIVRYNVDGKGYIFIPAFLKHQKPHSNEAASCIPGPPERENFASGDEGLSTMEQSTFDHGSKSFSSGQQALGPDSLNEECGMRNDESGMRNEDSGSLNEEEEGVSSCDENARSSSGIPSCPHQGIVDLYHSICPELPRVEVWGEPEKRALRSRWRERPERRQLSWWESFFRERIQGSDFLMGRVKDFQANLSWIVKQGNFNKILNGQFENRGPRTGSGLGDRNARVCQQFLEQMERPDAKE